MRPRRELVDQSVDSTYHCTSRLARGAFLLSHEYDSAQISRKPWIEARLQDLTPIFAIDVDTFAFMDNHLHLVLTLRPSLARSWSAKEVARRWLMLFPPIVRPGTRRAATEDDIAQLAADSERISALRIRLCSLSEFHKALKEPLARLVNREEGVTGPFWGSRFKCRRVLDAPARLMTMAYVDMNPIRAKVARTPEESRFTGIWHRAKALKERLAERPKPSSRRRRPRGAAIARSLSRTGGESTHPFLTPIQSTPSRRGVFSDMTSEQYVAFVDRLGRVVRADKRGSIPPGIAPILQRLELDAHQFLEQVASTAKWFGSVVGTQESCAVEAERCRRRRVLSAVRLGAD